MVIPEVVLQIVIRGAHDRRDPAKVLALIHARMLHNQRIQKCIIYSGKRSNILNKQRQVLSQPIKFFSNILKNLSKVSRLNSGATLNHIIYKLI